MPISLPHIDLHFPDTHNIKLLGIADTSIYYTNQNIVNPSLEITPPGFNKVIIPVQARGYTVLNSNNLDLSCTDDDCNLLDLPDGIWKVKYSFAPTLENFVVKDFIRTTAIEIAFGKAVLKTDIKNCAMDIKNNDMDILMQTWFYIQGAIADANNCNPKAAMDKYQIALKMLKRFNC